ncbi:GIY-YIG catalytic domain-containing endonuclease [Paramecium bursaria Chlorella virus CviKI]|nr:GIY-YIG catalytic domain-containing endonuclease [Paramecium bursaria Chlorella virus CviKI]
MFGIISSFYVYSLLFPNEKMYIGYTSLTPEDRFSNHVKNSRKKKRKCWLLEKKIQEYGADNIIVSTLYKCWSKKEASDMEIRLIAEHKTLVTDGYGYNLTKGGDGGLLVGDAVEKHRKACLNREYRKPKEPTAAPASDIEDAIYWVQMMNLDMSKRLTAIIAGDLLDVSRTTIEDHMKRIGMSFKDARRICTDDQIDDALNWVMSQDFASMMNKTLVEELVGNQFGSDREIMRKYLKRHDNITLEGLDEKRGPVEHTEEAKQNISASNTGKKKSNEEIERRNETRRTKKIEEYALVGIDISDENLQKVLGEYETAYKTAKFLTKDKPELFDGIRSILRSYILTRT